MFGTMVLMTAARSRSTRGLSMAPDQHQRDQAQRQNATQQAPDGSGIRAASALSRACRSFIEAPLQTRRGGLSCRSLSHARRSFCILQRLAGADGDAKVQAFIRHRNGQPGLFAQREIQIRRAAATPVNITPPVHDCRRPGPVGWLPAGAITASQIVCTGSASARPPASGLLIGLLRLRPFSRSAPADAHGRAAPVRRASAPVPMRS